MAHARITRLALGGLCLLSISCNIPDRITNLEKQTQELQAEVKKDRGGEVYDLREKCARDAKAWFRENWPSDKDTILLNYSNHYNKSSSTCFVEVEYHYTMAASSWTNSITLWDIYENTKYGSFSELHTTYEKPEYKSVDHVMLCEVFGKKCKTADEFNGLARPYLTE